MNENKINVIRSPDVVLKRSYVAPSVRHVKSNDWRGIDEKSRNWLKMPRSLLKVVLGQEIARLRAG